MTSSQLSIQKRCVLSNQSGSMTLDYLFAFILVSGLSLVIITMTSTLSVVETVQYATYAASRNFFSANVSLVAQQRAAYRKFTELKSNPIVAPLLSGGWFEVPDQTFVADKSVPEKYPQFEGYKSDSDLPSLFHGVAVQLNAHILGFQVPYFGSTKDENNKSGDNPTFTTQITSFLGREPTFEESRMFAEERWEAIKNLSGGNYSTVNDYNGYVVIMDNGG